MKPTNSMHQKQQQAYYKEGMREKRSGSQKQKQFKEVVLSQKRISQIQILNKNIKRKLSLYNDLQSGSNATYSNMTQRIQPGSMPIIYDSPIQKKLQNKDKFTNHEQNIMAHYRRNFQQRQRQQYSNPFEIALVQMIEKEREVMLKKKKDMEFWKSKVKSLQVIYQQLNKTGLDNLENNM